MRFLRFLWPWWGAFPTANLPAMKTTAAVLVEPGDYQASIFSPGIYSAVEVKD